MSDSRESVEVGGRIRKNPEILPLVTRIDPGHEALKRPSIARLGWLSLLPSSLPIWISYTFLFFKPCFGLIFYDSIQHPLLELFLIADNQPLSCFFVIFPEHMKKGSLHRCMCMCARAHTRGNLHGAVWFGCQVLAPVWSHWLLCSSLCRWWLVGATKYRRPLCIFLTRPDSYQV